jgi:hypothetical protein
LQNIIGILGLGLVIENRPVQVLATSGFTPSMSAETARRVQAAAMAFTSTVERAAGDDMNGWRSLGKGRIKASWLRERLATCVKVAAFALNLSILVEVWQRG